MTMREIKEAWSKSKTNVEHKDFTGEYVKRTSIRLVKMLLQTTNDDDLLAENIIQNEDQHYDFSETAL